MSEVKASRLKKGRHYSLLLFQFGVYVLCAVVATEISIDEQTTSRSEFSVYDGISESCKLFSRLL